MDPPSCSVTSPCVSHAGLAVRGSRQDFSLGAVPGEVHPVPSENGGEEEVLWTYWLCHPWGHAKGMSTSKPTHSFLAATRALSLLATQGEGNHAARPGPALRGQAGGHMRKSQMLSRLLLDPSHPGWALPKQGFPRSGN